MKSVYLFQPQYAVEYGKQDTYYLPYSVACLWSYANTFSEISQNYHLQELGFRREDPQYIIERMQINRPDVVGFSCYVWNKKYCLYLASCIKILFPKCKIIFGGADTSPDLLKHTFIDSIMLGEGEESFVDFLLNDSPPRIYPKSRLQSLDFPSPYTSGIFDNLLRDNPSVVWSMTLETNRGCPFSCTFCDWGGVTYSKIRKFEMDRIEADIAWAIDKPVSYLVCADANFGVFKERDIQIARWIRTACDSGMIDAVNLQFAKNSTEAVYKIAMILGTFCRGVTVSVQSMNQSTLTAIKRRNMEINRVSELLRLSQKYRVKTYTEVILGLPEETLESWCDGLCQILEFGQHDSIDIWFANLLENSEMSQKRDQWSLKSVWATDYFALYNEGDWQGIQETVEIVNSTSTMTQDELVEAYMYGWLIVHWHIAGYSQVVARELRKSVGVQYRDYYDLLYKRVQSDETFADHFETMRSLVRRYLSTGTIDHASGHALHNISSKWMYDRKTEAVQLSIDCASSFDMLDETLEQVQRHFIFDKNTTYPVKLGNITINSQTATDDLDFYALRRQGLLKCHIEGFFDG